MAPSPASVTSDARLLTISQVVEMTTLSPATVYRLMADHSIVAIRIGRATRIPARCLDAFIEARIADATANLPQPMLAPMRVRPNRQRRVGGRQ
jgi:excisionase family DNA binding protein